LADPSAIAERASEAAATGLRLWAEQLPFAVEPKY